MLESEESTAGSTLQEAVNDARHNGPASKNEEDAESKDPDQKTAGQTSQKNKEKKKKKKQDTDKKVF